MSPARFKQKLLAGSENAHSNGLSWLLIILFLVLLSWAVVHFGGNKPDQASATLAKQSTRTPRTYSVFYSGGVFSPTNLRIHAGDLVKFQNSTHFSIRVVSDVKSSEAAVFRNSGDIAPSDFFAYTFSVPGIFNYHNEKDPNEAGTIIVR